MPVEFWSQLWNAGIPLFLLVVGIVAIWRQWRDDMTSAASQRERNIEALKDLGDKINTNSEETQKLTKSLSEFFLKHFP